MEFHPYWENKINLMCSASPAGRVLHTYNAFQARLAFGEYLDIPFRWADNALLAVGGHWWKPGEEKTMNEQDKCARCGLAREHQAHHPSLPPGLPMRMSVGDKGELAHGFVEQGAERANSFSEIMDRAGVVSCDDAEGIADRFIASHFNNHGKDRARISIPADPQRDDDIRLLAFIAQVRAERKVGDARMRLAVIAERDGCMAILKSAEPNTKAEAVIDRIDARINELPGWLVADLAEWMLHTADELKELRALMEQRPDPVYPVVPADEAPLDVAALPDFWDARRVAQGKDEKSFCAAELRRALEHAPQVLKIDGDWSAEDLARMARGAQVVEVMPKQEDDYYVEVCNACETAACWHGKFYCDKAKVAGTRKARASELKLLAKEHPDNYSRRVLMEVAGDVELVKVGDETEREYLLRVFMQSKTNDELGQLVAMYAQDKSYSRPGLAYAASEAGKRLGFHP